ncbi:hypothetical protein BY458DRAFT_531038 [Sporodiniella umbellata]|nr:hypothetical protein BY458DRAFT_531038 [Sporodiniella umbellata]
MTKAHLDLDDFSETTHKPRRRSGPKVFRCTGYGNCSMVFTRQEHLNRHERKHTGEKPYQCIVPGCHRMFTRNDNMRQHAERCPYRNNSTTATTTATTTIHGLHPTKRNPERTRPKKHRYSDDSEDRAYETSSYEAVSPSSLSSHPLRRRSAPRVVFSSHPYPTCFVNNGKPKRRLSAQDLFSSIDRLEDISHSSHSDEENAVDLTEDEFEALIGFREFHRAAVTMQYT